jgi:hypothetical protein
VEHYWGDGEAMRLGGVAAGVPDRGGIRGTNMTRNGKRDGGGGARFETFDDQ